MNTITQNTITVIIIVFLGVLAYFYLTRDDRVLVWNATDKPIIIQRTTLLPAPSTKTTINTSRRTDYYNTFYFPTRKVLLDYFDFKHYHGYKSVFKGFQFSVKYMGDMYTLGCPKSFRNQDYHLAIVIPARNQKGLMVECMPMDVHGFITHYPPNTVRWARQTREVRNQFSNPMEQLTVMSSKFVDNPGIWSIF